jgi:hypothetical protein
MSTAAPRVKTRNFCLIESSSTGALWNGIVFQPLGECQAATLYQIKYQLTISRYP